MERGYLKVITDSDTWPFVQDDDPQEVWEVQAQSNPSEMYGLHAVVVSYYARQSFAVNLFLQGDKKLPHQFYAVMQKGRLCFIPLRNSLEPDRQDTLYLKVR